MSSSVRLASLESIQAVVWKSWPLRDEWRRVWPTATLLVAAVLGVQLVAARLDMTLLVGVVLFLTTSSLWFPATYEMNSQGFICSVRGHSRVLPWKSIRRCRICRNGLLLLTTARPGPLDAVYGTFIPWNDHRQQILAALNRRLPPPPSGSPNAAPKESAGTTTATAN